MIPMPDLSLNPAHFNMIESQLRPNRVISPAILAAFAAVRREDFVQPEASGHAYMDEEISLSVQGRFLLSPLILGQMLQAADIQYGEQVLLVGVGEGYLAALMLVLGAEMVAIESSPELALKAQKNITPYLVPARGADAQIQISMVDDMASGFAARAPYTAIIINGGLSELPEAMPRQLAEGGRLIGIQMPAADSPLAFGQMVAFGQIMVWEKRHGKMSQKPIADCAAGTLPGFEKKKEFTF